MDLSKTNSLRDLYYRLKDRGLFEQNYRYFIRTKKLMIILLVLSGIRGIIVGF